MALYRRRNAFYESGKYGKYEYAINKGSAANSVPFSLTIKKGSNTSAYMVSVRPDTGEIGYSHDSGSIFDDIAERIISEKLMPKLNELGFGGTEYRVIKK